MTSCIPFKFWGEGGDPRVWLSSRLQTTRTVAKTQTVPDNIFHVWGTKKIPHVITGLDMYWNGGMDYGLEYGINIYYINTFFCSNTRLCSVAIYPALPLYWPAFVYPPQSRVHMSPRSHACILSFIGCVQYTVGEV